MPDTKSTHRAPLHLESLESRLAPSTGPWPADSFDTTAAGQLPTGWAQWSSTGQSAFAATSVKAVSPANSLAAAPRTSDTAARAWIAHTLSADLEVSAALLADNLAPAQLLARGQGLNTAAPSYYAMSVTRGLDVQIVRVRGGVTTTLAALRSQHYFSNAWVRIALSLQGSTLRAQVFRIDNGTFLDSFGHWQDNPTWALTVQDSAIAAGGFVGLARPAGQSGTLLFDDFTTFSPSGDTQRPVVTLPSGLEGATFTGVKNISVSATDNVSVAHVEFLVDGVLRHTDAIRPFTWEFDTNTAANGTHHFSIKAYDLAGNVGAASFRFASLNPGALVRPALPRHYPHIRIAQLAYGIRELAPFEEQMLRDSVDLVITETTPTLSAIGAVAPNTPQMLYTNVSTLYREMLTDWLAFADRLGVSRESAFYHVRQATPFSGNSPSSQPVTWFWTAYRGGSSLLDVTSRSRGLTSAGLTLGGAGESVYLASLERFREINFNLMRAAAGTWSAVLEYVSAVDSAGRPTRWSPLTTLGDTTGGLRRSGRVTFTPPADWKTATLNGSARLFYVRLRTTAAGTAPVARSILGRDYVHAADRTSGIIPTFDEAADMDGDGYLNEAEYARRTAGKDARFFYESRAFYGTYGQMRFATNPSSPAFRSWAVDYSVRLVRNNFQARGLFIDNSSGAAQVSATGVQEFLSSYTADYASLLGAIAKAINPRFVLPNTVGGGTYANDIISQTTSYYEEFALRPLGHTYVQFEAVAARVSQRRMMRTPPSYAVLDSQPTGGSPTDARTQIATLAYYYLLADPESTFLNFYGGFEPGTSWDRHWVRATAYNVGLPLGNWSMLATGQDAADGALSYRVYQRPYANALVLYKPLSYDANRLGTLADATATRHVLGGSYRPLHADGTLGSPTSIISLRNGEGAILVRM